MAVGGVCLVGGGRGGVGVVGGGGCWGSKLGGC